MRLTGGFSIVELLLALAITLIVSAGVFAVVRSAHEATIVQPELADLQQRARVASDTIYADLVVAGAPGRGVNIRSLARTIPAVLPFRTGPVQPDLPGTFKDDTLTVVYAPADGWQTTIAQALTPGSASVLVDAGPGCPLIGAVRDPACGLRPDDAVMVFDDTGAYDDFSVVDVTGNVLGLAPSNGGQSHTYRAGSPIVQVSRVTYYVKATSAQLMRYNGVASNAPAVDNVAALQFEYFAAAAGSEALVRLSPGELTDGPWRPDASAPNRYDADLLRIRRIGVRLRLRPADTGPRVPDLEVGFDVAPRAVNGEW